jgi:predicted ATPase/DNA-binding SARP family transcriptional activator
MHFKLLGPLEVEGRDGPLPLGGRKQRTVLADLLLYREDGVSDDRLVFDVWGDEAPPSAARTLKAYVSRLRSQVGEDTIVRTHHGYQLLADPDDVDADRFERLVSRAEAMAGDDPAGAAEGYRSALDLWRGDVLGELGAEEFARPEVVRLEELRDLAQEAWFDVELESGRHLALVPRLREAVIARPHREHTWFQLMLALYRSERRADALRAYQQAARALGEALGIEPGPELRHLEEQILLHDPDLRYRVGEFERHVARANPTNLREPVTSFVGRGVELHELDALTADSRLVTITGPGGVGKTRLAVEAGWRLLDRFPGGVWDVDLAQQIGGGDVLGPLASALGVGERGGGDRLDHVIARIGDTATLVVLDNCEHVVAAVAGAVGRLVADCPNLSVLATSRTPLDLPGEGVFALAPLALPGAGLDDLTVLTEADSVQLFLHRGASAHPGFRLSAANAVEVAAVVRLLDGIPLALELAAARLALLTPGQIALELEEGFPAYASNADGGVPHRHDTLRAVIDWSYDLLQPVERTLLDRIGVLAADFTVEEAAAVCSSDEVAAAEVPSLIESLTSKSMLAGPVRAAADGRSRYRALELVSRYGVDRLTAAGDLERWQLRHVTAMESAAGEAARNLHGPEQKAWYDRLRSSQAEFNRALDYASDLESYGLGRRLCAHLWLWWFLDGKLKAGVDWIDRFTGGVVDPDDPLTAYLLAAKAELLSERGGAAEHTGISDEDRVLSCVGQAVAAARQIEDRPLEAEILLLCGDALSGIGRYDESEPLLEGAAKAFAAMSTPWGEGWAVLRLVRVHALGRTDFATADAHMERATPLLEAAGEVRLSAYGQLMYANRARLHSRYSESLDLIRGALRTFRELGFDGLIDEALLFLVSDFVELGRAPDALAAIAEMRQRAWSADEPSWLTVADIYEAMALQRQGDYASSVAILDATIRRCRAGGDHFNAGVAANALVWSLLGLGDIERAAAIAVDAVEAWGDIAHPWHQAASVVAAGEASLAIGEVDAAAARFGAGLGAYSALRHPQGLAGSLEGLAGVARQRGQPFEAARLLGAAGQLRDECGAPPMRRIVERNRGIGRWSSAELGEERYTAAWEAGVDAAGDPASLEGALDIRALVTPS